MRRIVVTSWMTLDGFVAGPNDEMDWVGRFYDKTMGEYETELVRGGDTLLLGRTTYESFAGAWPFVPDKPGCRTRSGTTPCCSTRCGKWWCPAP